MTLIRDADYWYAGVYMVGTTFGCLAAVIAGTALANRFL
jgi:fluoride ion exporter CrcB/FEX